MSTSIDFSGHLGVLRMHDLVLNLLFCVLSHIFLAMVGCTGFGVGFGGISDVLGMPGY